MIELVIRADWACDPESNYFEPAILGIENKQIVFFHRGFDLKVASLETVNYQSENVAPGIIDDFLRLRVGDAPWRISQQSRNFFWSDHGR